jgi:hypothetical protein
MPPVKAKPVGVPAAPRPAAVVIPEITWSSAPPPIAPRSFETPPPPPASPSVDTEAPPPVAQAIEVAAPPRIPIEDARRALEIRDEARVLLQQVLEEALAPLHYAVRDLERRLEAIEQRPPAPPGAIGLPPVAPAPSPARAAPAPPPVATVVVRQASPDDPYGSVVAARPAPPIAPRSGLISIDVDLGDVPFSGARRKRRVIVFFVVFLLVVFGTLFGAALLSRISRV